jgi:hypothetical protein
MDPNYRYDKDTESVKFKIIDKIAWVLDDCRTEDCPDEPSASDVGEHTYFSGHGPMGVGIEQQNMQRNRLDSMQDRGSGCIYLNEFPREIKQRIEERREYCNYGLLPEINRAWISVDSVLYLWNYVQADMEIFDIYNGSTSMITSVCLSTPKSNIFHEKINYILVVATRDDLYILGIEHKKDNSIQLFPTEFITPTDDVTILKMVGTRWGKVYMIGDNSLLYELDYGYEEGLFALSGTYKCKKVTKSSLGWKLINLLPNWGRILFSRGDFIRDLKCDNVRQLLYCVSNQGCITVHKIENDGSCQDVGVTNNDTIRDMVLSYYRNKMMVPPNDNANVTINDTFITSFQESRKYCFVVVLSDGQRVYLQVDDSTLTLTPYKILNIPSLDEISRNCGSGSIGEKDYKRLQSVSNNELTIHKSFYSKGVFILGAKIIEAATGGGKNVVIVIYESHQCLADDGSSEMVLMFDDRGEGSLREFMNEEVKDIAEQVSYYTKNDTVAGLMTTYTLEKPAYIEDFVTRDSLFEHINPAVSASAASQQRPISGSCFAPDIPCVALPRQGIAPSWGLSKTNLSESNPVRVCSEQFLQHVPVPEEIFRSFVCITDKGVHIFNKLRPSDIFMRAAFARLPPERLLLYIKHYGKLRINEVSPLEKTIITPPETHQFFTNNRLRQCLVTILGCICELPHGAGILQGAGLAGQYNHIRENIVSSLREVMSNSNVASSGSTTQETSKQIQETLKALKKSFEGVTKINSVLHAHNIIVDAWYVLISRILKPVFQSRVFDNKSQEEVFSHWLSDGIINSTLHYLGIAKNQLYSFYSKNLNNPYVFFENGNENISSLPIDNPSDKFYIGGSDEKLMDCEKIRRLHFFIDLNIQFLELIKLLRPIFKEKPSLSSDFKLFDIYLGQKNSSDRSQYERSFTAQFEEQNYYMLRYIIRELLIHMITGETSGGVVDRAEIEKITNLEREIRTRCSYFYSDGDSFMFEARRKTFLIKRHLESLHGGNPDKKHLNDLIDLWMKAIIGKKSANCVMYSQGGDSIHNHPNYNYPIKINDFIFKDLFQSLGKLLKTKDDAIEFRKRIVDLCYKFYIEMKSSDEIFDVLAENIISMMVDDDSKRYEFFAPDLHPSIKDETRVKVSIQFLDKFQGESNCNYRFLKKLYNKHNQQSQIQRREVFFDFIIQLMEKLSVSLRQSIIGHLNVLRLENVHDTYILLRSLRECYRSNLSSYHEASNIMYDEAMATEDIPIDKRVEYLEYAEEDARQYQIGFAGRGNLRIQLENNYVRYARIQRDALEAAESRYRDQFNIKDQLRLKVLWTHKTPRGLMDLIYELDCYSKWELLLRHESLNVQPNKNYCRTLWALIMVQECFRDLSLTSRDEQENSRNTLLNIFPHIGQTATLRQIVTPQTLNLTTAAARILVDNTPIYLKYSTHPRYLPEISSGLGSNKDYLLPIRLQKVIHDIIQKDRVKSTFDPKSFLIFLVDILASEEYPIDLPPADNADERKSLRRNCLNAFYFIKNLPLEIENSNIMTRKQMLHILSDPTFYPYPRFPSAPFRIVWLYLWSRCEEDGKSNGAKTAYHNDLLSPDRVSLPLEASRGEMPNEYVVRLMANDLF